MSLFSWAVRGLLLRGRTLALMLLPLAVGAVAVSVRLWVSPSQFRDVYATLAGELLIALVVALVALILGVNTFDDEREGGTLPLLMSITTPRWRIVGAKLAAAWLATVLVSLPAVVGCGVLGSAAGLKSGQVWGSLLAASTLSAAAYVSVFTLLSLRTKRALLIGLAYVVVWEGSLANFATALRNLSIGAFGGRVVGAPFAGARLPFIAADVSVVWAGVVLALVAAVAALLAVRRINRVDATVA